MSKKNVAFGALLLLMSILLFQSSITMFVQGTNVEGIDQLDIIFRTALSSIFGYIISIVAGGKPKITSKPKQEVTIQNETSPEKKTDPPKNIMVNIQVVVISAICVYCLLSIMAIRNFPQIVVASSSTSSTISLYRDFISGGIGALIGLSKSP